MNQPESCATLVALLGQRDQPTDGVDDYCVCLEKALRQRGVTLELVRVPWAERGWLAAFRWLWRESAQWRKRWVLVQYTALGWSRRGFSLGLLPVLLLLRLRKLSFGVVFHDPEAYPGTRAVDRVRRVIQQFVMRQAAAQSTRVILPVSSENLAWLRPQRSKAVFIPVGSNIPAPPTGAGHASDDLTTSQHQSKMVAVFGITPGARGEQEMTDILKVMKAAAQCSPRVQLCAFGRGTIEAEPVLQRLFERTEIEILVLGLLPAAQIGEILFRADVQVDVRSRISSRRGSVVAGIVCGTPVVGFESTETDDAIREAGVVLVAPGDIRALATTVIRILSDNSFQEQLRVRNHIASRKCFSWDAISDQLLRALAENDHVPSP